MALLIGYTCLDYKLSVDQVTIWSGAWIQWNGMEWNRTVEWNGTVLRLFQLVVTSLKDHLLTKTTSLQRPFYFNILIVALEPYKTVLLMNCVPHDMSRKAMQ